MSQNYISRNLSWRLKEKLSQAPVVAIIGPRQCGKSTLAKKTLADFKNSLYLDLERPSDRNKLRDAEAFFETNHDRIICLDEIQRVPELFPVMRWAADQKAENGRFLVLGSASPNLLKQSAESLAGRISYLELTPFLMGEVTGKGDLQELRKLWLRGGFPRSFLAGSDRVSREWRDDFTRTFLERELPMLAARVSPGSLDRFWKMAAHIHGHVLNRSKLGESLGISHHTVQAYADLLSATFMLRILPPLEINIKKRLIKSPKLYIRDSGILHSLLEIDTFNDLLGHPAYGASWEGFALENILAELPGWTPFYYRTASGIEMDLVLQKGKVRVALEFKASSSPVPSKGFKVAADDLEASRRWIVAPLRESYSLAKGIMAGSPQDLIAAIR